MKKANQIPLGPPPPRRPSSVRRTSSMLSHSFESFLGPCSMWGHGRDLVSIEDAAAPLVIAEDTVQLKISADREITAIAGGGGNEALQRLKSVRLAGALRKSMAELIPQDVEQSTILHRLLDDTVGASIVTNSAYDAWGIIRGTDQVKLFAEKGINNTGLCISYSPGSNALTSKGLPNLAGREPTSCEVPLFGGDPYAWHEWDKPEGPNHLRLRRMDLWEEGGILHVDAGFQDSAAYPDTEVRMVFHEYRVNALIEPETFVLLEVKVQPGVLPHVECLQAPASAKALVGQSIVDFRRSVLAQLAGTAGCTHLNDVLRSLQDVVAMSEMLRENLARCQ